jgi:histidyl-tRNA synthetase
MKVMQRVKGTQDFLNLSLLDYVLYTFKKHVGLYHFMPIELPIIESVELFKRSLGAFTDVVSKEMFLIQTNDPEDQWCLRPELTASTMRAFLEAQPLTPWKVFSYGPMFRYERPQKGRYRQFHQINCEIIGSASVSQDALFITMLDRFFHEKLGLTTYTLQLNFLGSYEDRVQYTKVLTAFVETLEGICATCEQRRHKNLLRIFDCKNETCQQLYAKAPRVTDHLSAASEHEWEELQQELLLLSVSYAVNPRLVRGLDYYNKTVFEFSSPNLGAQNAFCGGGRYDRLAQELGSSQPHPALGAAIGIERLLLLLEPMVSQLPIPPLPSLVVIMPLAIAQQPLALLLADTLQAADICVDVLLEGDSLKSMLRRANKMGAAYTLILGEEEQKNQTIVIKNLMTGSQETVAQTEMVSYLRR